MRKLILYFLRKTERLLKLIINKIEPNRNSFDLRLQYPGASLIHPEHIKIGERVSIGVGVIITADATITIGHDTMIAARTIINTDTHNYNNHPMWKHRVSRPIAIGKHVWIGSSSIILPGIKIGDYAVIGAGSVVTKHVPEKAIVAGNPARILRYRSLEHEDSSYAYPGYPIYEDFISDNLITKRISE